MGLAKLFTARDVTHGRPWKRIVELAIPLILGNIAQQLYNTVDTIVVGKYVGDNALSAVGAAGPVLNLLLVLFVGISTGAGILVSQRFGAKDRDGLAKVIGNCLTLTAIVGAFTTVIGLIFARPLLTLLDTPESVFEWCAQYLTIFFSGSIGFIFYNIFAGILRGLGDSVSALLFLVITTMLNIVLDIWFVAGFQLGVPGVALATILAQTVSAILCAFKLLRMKDFFTLKASDFKPDGKCIRSIIGLGLPSGIAQSVFAVSALLVQSLTNSLGEVVMACNVVVMRIDSFAMMPAFSISMALTTFAGQNYGARRYDRIVKGAKQGCGIAFGVSVVLTTAILLFGENLAWVFTDTQKLVDLAMRMLRILGVGYLVIGVNQGLSGLLRGVGDTKTPMWVGIITQVVIRLPLAYLLAAMTKSEEWPNGSPDALFLSMVISWVLGAVFTAIAFVNRMRKLRVEMMDTATAIVEEATAGDASADAADDAASGTVEATVSTDAADAATEVPADVQQ